MMLKILREFYSRYKSKTILIYPFQARLDFKDQIRNALFIP